MGAFFATDDGRVGLPASAGRPLVKPDVQISRIRLPISSWVSQETFTE